MKYLDRTLIVSPYCLALCQSEKVFAKEMRRLGVPKDRRPEFAMRGVDACVHFFEDGDTGLTAIVCIGDTGKHSMVQVYALLVHEAVHVWQAVRESLGESAPSAEFEAYSIQSIAQELMDAWKRPKKARKKEAKA